LLLILTCVNITLLEQLYNRILFSHCSGSYKSIIKDFGLCWGLFFSSEASFHRLVDSCLLTSPLVHSSTHVDQKKMSKFSDVSYKDTNIIGRSPTLITILNLSTSTEAPFLMIDTLITTVKSTILWKPWLIF
jgi:hypothetical protein